MASRSADPRIALILLEEMHVITSGYVVWPEDFDLST